ncbi:glycosyltransferase [Rhodobacteraceae bacterium NNCM2]|nr:glycosyltransferase [Coraliihabitans acroporae]
MTTRAILHLVNSLGSGGAERFVADLAIAQATAGHRVTVVTLSPAEALGDPSGVEAERVAHLTAAGMRVETIGHRARQLLVPGALRLGRLVRAARPDIIHSHLLTALLLLRLGGVAAPAVATHHNTPLPTRRWLFRRIAARAGAWAAVSKAAMPVLSTAYDGPLRLIHNGIADADLPARAAPAPGPLRVISLGNLTAQKNYAQVAGIAAELARRGVEAAFRIAGEGPERPAIAAEIARQGVEGHVTLLGARRDTRSLLAESDLYLLTSRWEGMPIAVIEALQAGLPVIAADVGGCGEILGEDQACGVLLPAGDTAAFADRIADLAGDPDLRARMGAAARERARQFSIDRAAEAYDALYHEVLA